MAGLAAVPLARLAGKTGENWNPAVIRPPGALPEEMFLQRCIKCGQCMRICPTNVIHPAALQAGIEGIWTPILNFRMGTSGCQRGCIACGNLCPTAAIRPISLDERLGRGDFADRGPIRIGTAFVDRGRCLPWAMDRPCIVCQENCPVSPKAIVTREAFQPVRLGGALHLIDMKDRQLRFDGPALPAERFATGDYFVTMANSDAIPRCGSSISVRGASPWRKTRLRSPPIPETASPFRCACNCPSSIRPSASAAASASTNARSRDAGRSA